MVTCVNQRLAVSLAYLHTLTKDLPRNSHSTYFYQVVLFAPCHTLNPPLSCGSTLWRLPLWITLRPTHLGQLPNCLVSRHHSLSMCLQSSCSTTKPVLNKRYAIRGHTHLSRHICKSLAVGLSAVWTCSA